MSDGVEGEKKEPTVPAWVWGGGALLLLVMFKSCGDGPKPSEPPRFGHVQALTMCQMALKSAARDPENADIPYVENFGSGDEYYYAWGAQTKMARMRNGLGLEVAASASCIVNGKTQRITTLTLNGQTLI